MFISPANLELYGCFTRGTTYKRNYLHTVREREREMIKAAEDKAEAEAKAAALEVAELQKKPKLRDTVAAEAEDALS